MLIEKGAGEGGDLIDFLVESEVPGIQDVDLGVGHVALVGLRPGQRERGIVLAPQDEQRGPGLPKPGLPLRIGGDVRLVVVEEVGLDLSLPGP